MNEMIKDLQEISRIKAELSYGKQLALVAREENKRLRVIMGYHSNEDRDKESPILAVIAEMGEATAGDIASRLGIKVRGVQDQIRRLEKLRLIKPIFIDKGNVPTIWVIRQQNP